MLRFIYGIHVIFFPIICLFLSLTLNFQLGRRYYSGRVKCCIGTSRHGTSGRIRRGDCWNSELTSSRFALTVIGNNIVIELWWVTGWRPTVWYTMAD